MTSPPWLPLELFKVVDPIVHGQDALDAVQAVAAAYDELGLPAETSVIVYRVGPVIAFMPFRRHVHDQDCDRA